MKTHLPVRSKLLLPVLLGLCVACAKSPGTSNNPKSGVTGDNPSDIVATYGDQKITAAELNEHVKAQMSDLEEQRFQIRKQGLEQLINERLVKAEAAKRNVTEQELFKVEVEDKSPAPTEEQLQQFFKENTAQLPPGAKFEDFRDRIAMYLGRQNKEGFSRQFIEGLRKNANVTVSLVAPAKPRIEVEAKGPSKGPADAKITIVEFSDFQCPYCSRARETVDQVIAAYPGKIRLIFRNYPLEFHKEAKKAAEASLCANDQGKFWEFHDTLFGNQQKLTLDDLKAHAQTLGLDAGKFGECLTSNKYAKTIEDDMAAGQKAGVSGTPAFFINGVMLSGAQPADEFKRIIDQELAM